MEIRFSEKLNSKQRPLRPNATDVLFDLDGTLSLMRGGWSDLMLSIFLEKIPRIPGESETALSALLQDDMMRQNGKPSIYQFKRFNERLQERGASALDPDAETDAFVERLQVIAHRRRDDVRNGKRVPESVLVPGSLPFLKTLKSLGLKLWLASGTEQSIVNEEVNDFGFHNFFEDRIFSYTPGFSKVQVIEKIMSQPGMTGERLVAFGDGFVEINETAKRQGLAIAVASDESWVDRPPYQGTGKINSFKDGLLLEAGASLVIPDYTAPQELIKTIFGK